MAPGLVELVASLRLLRHAANEVVALVSKHELLAWYWTELEDAPA
jgi:hypothetical protein